MSDYVWSCSCAGDNQDCGFDTSAAYVNLTAYQARVPSTHVLSVAYRWRPGDPIFPGGRDA